MSAGRPTVGVVLAGGASRRYGSDKLVARPGDGPELGQRAVDALARAVDRVMVVGGGDERAGHAAAWGARFVADLEFARGPLFGLQSARAAEPEALLVVLPGDLVAPELIDLEALTAPAANHGGASIGRVADRAQWLVSAWAPDTSGPLAVAIEAGVESMRASVSTLLQTGVAISYVALGAAAEQDLDERRPEGWFRYT